MLTTRDVDFHDLRSRLSRLQRILMDDFRNDFLRLCHLQGATCLRWHLLSCQCVKVRILGPYAPALIRVRFLTRLVRSNTSNQLLRGEHRDQLGEKPLSARYLDFVRLCRTRKSHLLHRFSLFKSSSPRFLMYRQFAVTCAEIP